MLDMRYAGQSYELIVPYSDQYIEAFHAAHLKEYSYQREGAPVEIVNVRVRATGVGDPPALPDFPEAGPDPSAAYLFTHPVVFAEETRLIHFTEAKGGNLSGSRLCSGRYDSLLVDGVQD
jgi:N-methylhydantoinase A